MSTGRHYTGQNTGDVDVQGVQRDMQDKVWLVPLSNAGGQLLSPDQKGLRGLGTGCPRKSQPN